MMKEFTVTTNARVEMVDITHEINKFVKEAEIQAGICTIFIPHTTAAVTINENADPDVVTDMTVELSKIIPFKDNYRHLEGNSAAHIKASMFGVSETVIINNNRLLLGTWQGIYFCEFDGPRTRKVVVRITE